MSVRSSRASAPAGAKLRRRGRPVASRAWASAFAGVLCLVAGCSLVSREARIEAKLEKAGLKPDLARCMAHKLDAKLSDAQLETLAAAAKAAPGDEGGHHHKLGALTARLSSIDDPRIVEVVSRAGIGCTILG